MKKRQHETCYLSQAVFPKAIFGKKTVFTKVKINNNILKDLKYLGETEERPVIPSYKK